MLIFGAFVFGSAYQEIATACGLAMTVMVEGWGGFALVHSVTKVVLRDGTQAVPYNEIRRAGGTAPADQPSSTARAK